MPTTKLIGQMIDHFHEPRWVEHSLKVFAYSQGIGGEEGLDRDELLTLGAAALLHDIGIPSARKRHGDTAKRDYAYHEREGADLAPSLLERADFPQPFQERIVWLVGHHHQEDKTETESLLQLLLESDYLVNLSEGNIKHRTPEDVLVNSFATETGKRYLRNLFGL